jgi:hypothetical protein
MPAAPYLAPLLPPPPPPPPPPEKPPPPPEDELKELAAVAKLVLNDENMLPTEFMLERALPLPEDQFAKTTEPICPWSGT